MSSAEYQKKKRGDAQEGKWGGKGFGSSNMGREKKTKGAGEKINARSNSAEKTS